MSFHTGGGSEMTSSPVLKGQLQENGGSVSTRGHMEKTRDNR